MSYKLHEGTWGEDASWEFWVSRETPPHELCTAVACVAIVDLETRSLVLTQNQRGWEMLAGRVDPGETIEETLARESIEEGGFVIDRAVQYGFRKIINHRMSQEGTRRGYPPVGYNPHYYAFTNHPIGEPTGDEIIQRDIFTLDEVQELANRGEIQKPQFDIIKLGFMTAIQDAER